MILSGYTGRDGDAVAAHIAELRAQGISAPERVPAFYAVGPNLLSQDRTLVTTVPATSGEVEFALVVTPNDRFVAVASDHTDRIAEVIDVALSKRVCAKVLSAEAWRLDDVIDHWDEMQLRSWTGSSQLEPYQTGLLGQLIEPGRLIDSIPWHDHPDEYVILGGTIPTISGVKSERWFRAELRDSVRAKTIALEYEVTVLSPLRSTSRPAGDCS